MSDNGNIADLLAPVLARYEQAKKKQDLLFAELAEARAETNKMLAILKAAGIIERQPHEKKEVKKVYASISEAKTAEVLGLIRKYIASHGPIEPEVPGSFVIGDIQRAFKLHRSQVGAAVEQLREQGALRAAGQIRRPPNNRRVNLFVIEG